MWKLLSQYNRPQEAQIESATKDQPLVISKSRNIQEAKSVGEFFLKPTPLSSLLSLI